VAYQDTDLAQSFILEYNYTQPSISGRFLNVSVPSWVDLKEWRPFSIIIPQGFVRDVQTLENEFVGP